MVLDLPELGRKFSELMTNIFVNTLKNLRIFGQVCFSSLNYFLKTILPCQMFKSAIPASWVVSCALLLISLNFDMEDEQNRIRF